MGLVLLGLATNTCMHDQPQLLLLEQAIGIHVHCLGLYDVSSCWIAVISTCILHYVIKSSKQKLGDVIVMKHMQLLLSHETQIHRAKFGMQAQP